MAQKKLKLDKFRISKLTNPSKIRGGVDPDNGDTGVTYYCIETSLKWVKNQQ